MRSGGGTLLYIVVMIVWALAAKLGGKNKKKRRADKMPQPAAKKEKRSTPHGREVLRAKAPEAKASFIEELHEGDDPCHAPMREGFDDCGEHEGDDPCHPRMEHAPLSDSPIEETMIGTEERSEEMRRFVLEGIVMSEVLKRPSERRR